MEVATTCAADLSLTLPMVVDDMQDTVNLLYHAWPERLYVIEKGGRIAYKGGIGPMDFKVDEGERALQKVLRAGR